MISGLEEKDLLRIGQILNQITNNSMRNRGSTRF